MNAVNLVGRISQDLELRYTKNHNAFVNFNLAVKRPYKEDGEQDADFFRITAWGKLAENLVQYMNKGGMIAVTGYLKTSSYEDKNGTKHYAVDVIADKIEYLIFVARPEEYDDGFPDEHEDFTEEDLPF